MAFPWLGDEARTTHEDLHLQGRAMQMTLDAIKEQISEIKEQTKEKHREMEEDIKEIKNKMEAINTSVILQQKGISVGSFLKDFGFQSFALVLTLMALYVSGIRIAIPEQPLATPYQNEQKK
jgi:hypothetical protein